MGKSSNIGNEGG